MHRSAYDKADALIASYLSEYRSLPLSFLELGSKIVEQAHYSTRALATAEAWKYTGADIEAGRNVDVVLTDPYYWKEIPSNSIDVLLCSQVFEHIRYPWVTIYEVARVLKPKGIAILIAPAAGLEHRWPYDCWRIYPDGWQALADYTGALDTVEQHTQWNPLFYTDGSDKWQDSTLVCQKRTLTAEEHAAFIKKMQHQQLIMGINSGKTEEFNASESLLPVFTNRSTLTTYEQSRKTTHGRYFSKYKKRRLSYHLRYLLKHLLLPERFIK